jgi:threonylcarbamoyladenosine tRNA methylthiotransferase CDKAL1
MARILIETYGCTLNQADSDIMSNVLQREGHSVDYGRYEEGQSYDYVIVNTCTVKKGTEQKIAHRLQNMRQLSSRLIVTGCMASANADIVSKAAPGASMLTTSNVTQIGSAVQQISSSGRTLMTQYRRVDKLAVQPLSGAVIARIAISEGCQSFCNFCETKFARGPLNSYSSELILRAIKMNIENGAREIELTSQDVGAYGADKRTNIAELVSNATSFDGDYRIRIGMLNPEHLHRYFDELVEVLKNEKVYKFLHLPIQSGSDKVLREMKRNYTVEQFTEYVTELKNKISNITIATDMIVGYPTETDDDFLQSVELLRQVRPGRANISRFGARPHAEASEYKQLDNRIVKRRTTDMYRLGRRIEQEEMRRIVGTRQRVLVTERNSRSFLGRDNTYREIAVIDEEIKLGEFLDVEIVGSSSACLIGKRVEF